MFVYSGQLIFASYNIVQRVNTQYSLLQHKTQWRTQSKVYVGDSYDHEAMLTQWTADPLAIFNFWVHFELSIPKPIFNLQTWNLPHSTANEILLKVQKKEQWFSNTPWRKRFSNCPAAGDRLRLLNCARCDLLRTKHKLGEMHKFQPVPLTETSNKLYTCQLHLLEAFTHVSHRYSGISISWHHLRTHFCAQELQKRQNHGWATFSLRLSSEIVNFDSYIAIMGGTRGFTRIEVLTSGTGLWHCYWFRPELSYKITACRLSRYCNNS